MKSEVVAQIQVQQKQTCVIDPRARMQIRDAYAEKRFTEIERENKKLLNKMSEILGKT